jgi:hypothetical protein
MRRLLAHSLLLSGAANHFPEFTLLGALQFVSAFKTTTRQSERAQVYTCNAVEICKVTID